MVLCFCLYKLDYNNKTYFKNLFVCFSSTYQPLSTGRYPNSIIRERESLKKKGTTQWGIMVFKATFNYISVISLRSVLLVEEIGVCGENHRSVASN
jgi:hypothetical protein